MSLRITNKTINFIRVNWVCKECNASQKTQKGEVLRFFLTSFDIPKAIAKCVNCAKINTIILNSENTKNNFESILI